MSDNGLPPIPPITPTPLAPIGVPPTGVVGELSEQARASIQSLQQQQNNLQFQIGALEVQKAQVLSAIENGRQQLQRILQAEGVRLGIPQGRPWQVTPDGKAVLTG